VQRSNLIEPLLGLKYEERYVSAVRILELNRTTFGIEISKKLGAKVTSTKLNRTTFGIEIRQLLTFEQNKS